MIVQQKFPFIVLDGLDGCGKDTQMSLFQQAVQNGKTKFDKSTSIWMTKEQTNITEQGKRISEKQKTSLTREEATNLFIQDRLLHTSLIKDVRRHSLVISSRYFLVTLAYQSVQGTPMETIWDMHTNPTKYFSSNEFTPIILPEYYFFLKISSKEAMRRIELSRGERQAYEKLEFLEKAEIAFDEAIVFLKNKGVEIIEIDGEQSVEEVSKEILSYF